MHSLFKSLTIVAASITTSLITPSLHAGDDAPNACNQLELVGSIALPLGNELLQIQGDRAYLISDFDTHFSIIDITDPESMTLISHTPIANRSVKSYFVRGDYAYILYDHGGFSIYDIQDEYDPWYVRGHTLLNSNSMVFSQDIIYGRERLLNITRPRSPRLTDSTLPTPFGYNGETILVDQSNIYTDSLARYDITDPLTPVLTSPALVPFITLIDVIIQPTTIYGRNNQTLYAFDQSNPNEITLTSTFSTDSNDFAARGSLVYTIDQGLRVFDYSNPSDPMEIAYFQDIPGLNNLVQIERVDDLFYITDDSGTLAVYRINTNPVATHPTQDQALEIKLIDNLALIADNSAGLQIFDISNPQSPTLLSTFPTNNTAIGVDAIPGVAFVATHQSGLDIVDISDPYNPTLITNYDTTRSTQDVQIVGQYAYVVDRVTGLHILDISDPSNPQVVSITDTPGLAEDITIADNIALISHGKYDLQILDISDRTNPQIISTITPIDTVSSGISATTVHDGLLYTAETRNGYRVFDFSNPASPIEIASINTDTSTDPGFGLEIVIEGNRLILANGTAGLSIYNNTDPTSPDLIHNYPSSLSGSFTSSFRKLMLQDSIAYIAAQEGGLRIFDINNCALPCAADLNDDTILDFFDISIFLSAFSAQDPIADLTNDGIFDFFDVSVFLSFFSTGCP